MEAVSESRTSRPKESEVFDLSLISRRLSYYESKYSDRLEEDTDDQFLSRLPASFIMEIKHVLDSAGDKAPENFKKAFAQFWKSREDYIMSGKFINGMPLVFIPWLRALLTLKGVEKVAYDVHSELGAD